MALLDKGSRSFTRRVVLSFIGGGLFASSPLAPTAWAQGSAFEQSVALSAAKYPVIAAFYQARDYQPIWTGPGDAVRRRALFRALIKAPNHGLPVARYDADQLTRDFGSIRSAKARGILEVETTKMFLTYVHDIQSGAVEPSKIDVDMAIKLPRRDPAEQLVAFMQDGPDRFLKSLPPKHPDYVRLMKEKVRLERIIQAGGWGPTVSGKAIKPGQKGRRVLELRLRLSAMGFKRLGISPTYDSKLEAAVTQFQIDHGLNVDGVAGAGTLKALNVSPEQRLEQVIIGLERQRWLNKDRGRRHIFVNQADFRAFVMDDGKPTLTTRVVVGKAYKFRTPEFTDEMTHMIINPTWHVPKSIARKEYLPQLKKDPDALRRHGLRMTDVRGRVVDPTTLDYEEYGINNFPFDLKQPPGSRNALGKVKFMFPNKFNIYLHDTPSKSLFNREVRAYSHGCVRVQKPFELAYTLLGRQSDQPENLFHDALATRRETQIDLVQPIPVHLVYHTAWVAADGRANYRADIYGRDKKVLKALLNAGVVMSGVQS